MVVAGPDRRNIVMVTRVWPRIFNGVLIHTCPEMATDADVVLPKGAVAPYPVILQFDLYGAFYRSQVVKTTGHVPIDDMSRAPVGHDPYEVTRRVATHLNAGRGLPCWRGTGRWRFKEEQLIEELRPLTSALLSRTFR